MASSGFLVVIPFRFKTQNTKVSSRKTQRREPWEQGWKKSRFLVINISMATHNQMTLILWNLKIILFIYSLSKYIVHVTCRSRSSYNCLLFDINFHSVLKKRIVINNWAMNNFLSLSDLLNCYFLERNVLIGLKLLKSF